MTLVGLGIVVVAAGFGAAFLGMARDSDRLVNGGLAVAMGTLLAGFAGIGVALAIGVSTSNPLVPTK